MKDYHDNRGDETHDVQSEKVRLYRGLRVLVWTVTILLLIPVILVGLGILLSVIPQGSSRTESKRGNVYNANLHEDPGAVAYRKAALAKEEAMRKAQEQERARIAAEERAAKEDRIKRFREDAEFRRGMISTNR